MSDLGDIVDTNEVLSELCIQNSEFNLFEFFDDGKSSSDLKGACGFITRRQSFYCFSPKYHAFVFENVGSSVFDDGNVNENVYYTSFNKYVSASSGRDYSIDAWRFANADFGVVSIQLLSKKNVFVWVPNKINDFQKQTIINFCSEMININSYLKETGFNEIDVLFSVMGDKDYGSKLEMNEFLSKINDYVSNDCFCPYENIVSSPVRRAHK